MLNIPRLHVFTYLFVAAACCSAQDCIIYDNAMVNTLSNTVAEGVIVTNETTLNLTGTVHYDVYYGNPQCDTDFIVDVDDASTLQLNGGVIRGTEVFNSGALTALRMRGGSQTTMTSGTISASNGVDLTSSTFNFDGGNIWAGVNEASSGLGIRATGQSLISFNGGNLNVRNEGDTTGVTLSGTTSAVLSAGSIAVSSEQGRVVGSRVSGSATMTVNGGSINIDSKLADGIIASSFSQVEIRSGSVNANGVFGASGLSLSGGATGRIYGGFLGADGSALLVNGSAVADVFGGLVSGEETDIDARGNGQIYIHGSDFNYPLMTPIADPSGLITGNYRDGTPLSLTFARTENATIMLIPEPSTTPGLMACLLIGWIKSRRGYGQNVLSKC